MTERQSPPSQTAFWIIAGMLLLSVASSAVPSPIYPLYAADWHLTPVMLTAAFAIYVVGLLISLLTAGSLSDYVGRKPVLVGGSFALLASMALFSVANGFGMLLLARTVQGLAIGALIGALGAALIDHSLERHPGLAAVLNGATPPVALAVGALSSGAAVEWGPLPEQLVYLVYGTVLVGATVVLVFVPERVQRRPGALRSLLPTVAVPAASRSLFRSVLGALVASWGLGGLYLSLVPSALATLFGVTDHFAAGALIAGFTLVGAATGLAFQRVDARRAMLVGLVALVVGPAITLAFLLTGSLDGVIAGTLLAGVGFGAGFQSALRMLIATAAPEHRAGLLSSIYVASYLAFGVPSVIAGALSPVVGLTAALSGYAVFVILAASIALVAQVVSRRAARAEAAAEAALERELEAASAEQDLSSAVAAG